MVLHSGAVIFPPSLKFLHFVHGVERSTIKLRYVSSLILQTYRLYFLSKSFQFLRKVAFLGHDTSHTARVLR